jgi:hypothetical protein
MRQYSFIELRELAEKKTNNPDDYLAIWEHNTTKEITGLEACRTLVKVPRGLHIFYTSDPKLIPYIEALYHKIEVLPDYEEPPSPGLTPSVIIPFSDISLSPSDGPSPVTG